MESLLSGGYSYVHTRLGFDTKMLILKSADYMKRKDDFTEQLRNIYCEKNEKTVKKMLNQLLYNLFKQDDLNSYKNPIYSLRLDGKIEAKKRRVFSEIYKLDENYQYRFESLPIGVFKKELSVSMNLLNKSIKSINPNAKLEQFL